MRGLHVALVALLLVTGCIGSSSGSGNTGPSYKNVTSAAANGGLTALIAAAKKEGHLNLIATPRDWANYGAIIDGFKATYGIPVTVDNPTGSSADEIKAVQQLGNSSKAPDALDLEVADAIANANLFAPYKVSVWAEVPDAQKESTGLWYEDYGGYMSIGYDSSKLPPISSLADLLTPPFIGKVSIKGDPRMSDISLNTLMMASLASGGSPDDISEGLTFFHQLLAMHGLGSIHATSGTIKSGATPVVFDWEYLSLNHIQDIPTWSVVVPANALLGEYFAQAINKNAPHPAAARLWEEYLYSADGQNLLLKGLVRPVRMAAMQSDGTLDQSAASAMPAVQGVPVFLSVDQVTAARKYVASHWIAAMTCPPAPKVC